MPRFPLISPGEAPRTSLEPCSSLTPSLDKEASETQRGEQTCPGPPSNLMVLLGSRSEPLDPETAEESLKELLARCPPKSSCQPAGQRGRRLRGFAAGTAASKLNLTNRDQWSLLLWLLHQSFPHWEEEGCV